MSAESRVCVRCVVIGIPRTTKNSGDLDSALQTLFPKSKALQLVEAILLRDAVYDSVPKEALAHAGHINCRLDTTAAAYIFWVR
jgi:hypothetical protein